MKKVFVGLALVVVAALMLLPLMFGRTTEQKILEHLAAYNDKSPFVVSLQSYDRG